MTIAETCKSVKENVHAIAYSSEEEKNCMLDYAANAILGHSEEILTANKLDLERFERGKQLRDRLLLTPERLQEIADGLHQLRKLKCPAGEVLEDFKTQNGLNIRRGGGAVGVVGIN